MTATAEVAAPADEQIDPRPSRRPAWALVAICVLAGALYVWAIGAGQVGNSYYAAAAKSMSTSFTNFLFGSFDPYGVVTVDKPPMSLWPQAIAVWIFGFHGWAVLLPQVIEGVAAVFLLHRTVRLWADEKVALLAALIFALTPITVAINRDNNPDTLLVLLLVAAAYALTRSVQAAESRPRTKWLLWCTFFIGCGFLTKMLQAWIVVPGFALAYLVSSSAPVKRRILDLLAAGAVLVASSFWWVALHAWWPGSKPYIGGSTDGGAWDLIIGYNGLGRVFGGSGNRGGGPSGQIPSGQTPSGQLPEGVEIGGPGGMFGGQPGATRMFDASVGGQISWLLPLCLLVLVAVTVAGVLRWRRGVPGVPAERAGWFMWGSWLLVTAVVFSFAQGIFHPYYTTMLAPAVAAISAAGLVMFWRAKSFVRFLLPLSVAITAGWAFVVVSRDTSFHGWTRWAVLGIAAVAIVVLLAGLRRAGLVAALVAILLTPAVWSTATAATAGNNGVMPAAGPSERRGGGFEIFMNGQQPPNGMQPPNGQSQNGQPQNGRPNRGQTMGGPGGPGGAELTDEQKRILSYAKEHGGGAEITLAIAGSAQAASPYIMRTDEVVIGMGGFSGSDNAPSVDQLQQWVSEGKLKFVLGGGDRMGGGGPGGRGDNGRQEWITQHCSTVDPSAYGGGSAQTLMECHA
jgi:4-amino-4-deoxy-L-arabinose transferase-like glycosyltransferase